MPFSLAARVASFIVCTKSTVRVPMLSTRAEAMCTMSVTSSGAWAITGDAPRVFTIWAQSFMVTQLVR